MSAALRVVLSSLLLSTTALATGPTAPVGEPVPGLTADELAKFVDGRDLYEHDFTPEEGLGPLYRERACVTCHMGPATGGFDPDGADNNVIHFTVDTGPLGQNFQSFELGGPVQQHRTISTNFTTACQLPADTIPNVPGIGTSPRHTPAVFGFGLLDAIDDADILEYEGKQRWKKPGVVGLANWGVELEGLGLMAAFHLDGTRKMPIGAPRVGRFGWKAPTATLFQFTTEPFNIELGVSTPFFPRENHPGGDPLPPECLLPGQQPNDTNSQKSLRLYYFQAFLAAPDRAPSTPQSRFGERVFRDAGCEDCHRRAFRTGDYYAPQPDGTPFKVQALSRKHIEPYSDLLVHDMGDGLADQRPQGRASGRMWRTTPLWGIRHKTNLLHNGSVTTPDAAIRAHGGEASWSKGAYERLSGAERQALLAFLATL